MPHGAAGVGVAPEAGEVYVTQRGNATIDPVLVLDSKTIKKMKPKEMKALLKEKGLSTQGNKSEPVSPQAFPWQQSPLRGRAPRRRHRSKRTRMNP